MIPALSGGLDHVHVYVPSRKAAADWYADNLGFHLVEAYAFWTTADGGPMTIADPGDRIHFALFRSEKPKPVSLAFGVSAREYLSWRDYLTERKLLERESDHDKAWSLYFHDPYGNELEVTTYEHEAVRNERAAS